MCSVHVCSMYFFEVMRGFGDKSLYFLILLRRISVINKICTKLTSLGSAQNEAEYRVGRNAYRVMTFFGRFYDGVMTFLTRFYNGVMNFFGRYYDRIMTFLTARQ